jgi:predicted aminopeptidase
LSCPPVRLLRLGGLSALAVLLGGCGSLGYYAQAVKGHCQIVSRQKSCVKLIANTNTPPELRARLQLAAELCAYADTRLGLPANGAYTEYANLDRPYVVWNLYAAPEFSLAAKTWWYPFVGSLDYRGYFNESMARSHAGKLARQGFDVYVEGVEAYSTLGWFKDPLLNTFLHHQEPILAEVLFHELAHQKVFASGDTDFNEAFATVVARAGVRRWLRDRDAGEMLARYESALARNDAFVQIVQQARAELKQLYKTRSGQAAGHLTESGKERILSQLRENFDTLSLRSDQYAGYQSWFAGELNNAKLNSVATYYDLVPAFDRLLEQQQGDLEQFYAAVKTLTKLPEAKRHEELQQAVPTVAMTQQER